MAMDANEMELPVICIDARHAKAALKCKSSHKPMSTPRSEFM